MKNPQEYGNGGVIVLNDLNEKEKNNSRVQAMFKQSRHNNLSIFITSQGYYEIAKRTIRAIGIICHKFMLNNSRDVQNFHQDKAWVVL